MSNKSSLQAALESVELGQDAQEAIARLQERDLVRIDQSILSALDEYEDLPEALYALRVRALAQAARIEVNGDLDALKTCEIRLPAREDAR